MIRFRQEAALSIAEAQGQFSHPYPLGISPVNASYGVGPKFHDHGVTDAVNVSVYAPGLNAVDVVYTDPEGQWRRFPLIENTDGVFHGMVPEVRFGARYAFWEGSAELPANGQLLLDPYGRAIVPDHSLGGEDDDAAYVNEYVSPAFDWSGDFAPRVPWRNTVIYEAHVKGLTQLHPDVPEHLRGTYAGLASDAMIAHLKKLGVTTVQLLPIHFHTDEPHLQELGMPNYWGYNTLGFFAPHTEYASADAQAAGQQAVQSELKGMIKLLHAAGIEVVLDVVFNHTAEGGQDQPALCWRGLGDKQYYRHGHDGRYLDTTGCGNTLNFTDPAVIRMALDSLRYWVEEYHVDGFRFDLAVSLARDENHHFSPRHPFLVAALADSVLANTKLIAEPWDVSMGGWQTGHFPRGFADWNDRYRDTVRDFWVADRGHLKAGGHGESVARLAGCLAGSRDLFAGSGRGTLASINFVTAHDGFTLRDLVSFDRKHNEANGEQNRDGHNHNRSYNHGVEGHTGDTAIRAERLQTQSNVMATLLMSLGVPMITAGDEMGKTQFGNNNAYCQDNEINWLDWSWDDDQRAMFDTTRRMIRLRNDFMGSQPFTYPVQEEQNYILWFNERGEPMPEHEWSDNQTRVVQLLMGSTDGKLDGLVIMNGRLDATTVTLPRLEELADFRPSRREITTYELRFATSKINYPEDPDGVHGSRMHREVEREILRATQGDDAVFVPRKGEKYMTGDKIRIEGNSILIFRG